MELQGDRRDANALLRRGVVRALALPGDSLIVECAARMPARGVWPLAAQRSSPIVPLAAGGVARRGVRPRPARDLRVW